MASLFAITTVTDTIPLASNRQGQVAFTVSNTTNRSFRSHARLWSQPIAANAWVRLVGDAERDIAAGESQQYVAQIAAPADAAAGEYLLRLDMVDVSDPDESLSVGPTVKFTVPAPVAVKPKPFPWWIIAAVVLIVLLIVGGIYGIARAGQKAAPTPTLTPIATRPLSSWSGQGTYYKSTNTFAMYLRILTDQGSNTGDVFTGTLTESTYASEVNIVGQIISNDVSTSVTQITFTDTSSVSGTGIPLHSTYNATVTSGQIQGTWSSLDGTSGGTILLRGVPVSG